MSLTSERQNSLMFLCRYLSWSQLSLGGGMGELDVWLEDCQNSSGQGVLFQH